MHESDVAEKETDPLLDIIDSFLGWSKMSTSHKFGALFWVYLFGFPIFRTITDSWYEGDIMWWVGLLVFSVASGIFSAIEKTNETKKSV